MSRDRVEPIGAVEPAKHTDPARAVNAPERVTVTRTADAPVVHEAAPSHHNPIPDGHEPAAPVDMPLPPGPDASAHGASLQHHDHVGSFGDAATTHVPAPPAGALQNADLLDSVSHSKAGAFVHERPPVGSAPVPDANAIPDNVRRAWAAAQQSHYIIPAMQPALILRPVEFKPRTPREQDRPMRRPQDDEAPGYVGRVRRRLPRKKK